MRKGLKIFLCALLLVMILAAGVCWWQWDNITAIRISASTSRDDLSQMMEANDQRVDDVAEKMPVTVRDLTDEERAALRDMTMTREELIARLTGKDGGEEGDPVESSPAEEPDGEKLPGDESSGEKESPSQQVPVQTGQQESAGSQTPGETNGETNEESNEDKLAAYIAEIYLMKSEYTLWLEEAYNACIEEYVALPESERTYAAKYNLGMKYMREALAKEDECDLKMAEIQDAIRLLLTELGEDTSLVDEIQAAYEEEKALKKAYYLGLHS